MKPSVAIDQEMMVRGGGGTIATRTAIKADRWAVPMLALSIAIPIAASALYFMNASLRLDEAQSLWQVSRSASNILTIIASDVHVPLYHLALHYWLLLFGNSIEIARAFSLFFFLLSIPLFYMLGKRAYSARIGSVAAVLFAISPFMNWYANEIRMYTLFVFLTILNQYCFLRIFKDTETRAWRWLLYGASAILGIFTHYFFFLILLAQGVFYAVRRPLFPAGSLWRFLITALAVIGALMPWAWFVYVRGMAGFQEPLLLYPSTVDLFSTLSQFLFGFQGEGINTAFLSLWPIAAVIALVMLGRNRKISHETEYLMITLAVAFGVTFIGSYLVTPIYISRYLIFALPSAFLIIIGIFALGKTSVRLLVEGTLVALMLIALGIEMANPSIPVKENYAEAVTYLAEHTTPQDVILISAPFTIYPVKYYYRGPAAISTLPIWDQFAYGPVPDFDPATFPKEVSAATKSYQRAYLLLSYDQGYEQEIREYFDSQFEQLQEQEFSDGLTLYVYRLRYDTDRSAITRAL